MGVIDILEEGGQPTQQEPQPAPSSGVVVRFDGFDRDDAMFALAVVQTILLAYIALKLTG